LWSLVIALEPLMHFDSTSHAYLAGPTGTTEKNSVPAIFTLAAASIK
jgi:hypothetical protein